MELFGNVFDKGALYADSSHEKAKEEEVEGPSTVSHAQTV